MFTAVGRLGRGSIPSLPIVFLVRCFSSTARSVNNAANVQIVTHNGSDSQSLQHCPEFSGHIPLDDLQFTYSCASGPGGQHVNKTRSKVEVRFHVPSASWIPEPARARLLEKEAHRITKDSFFIIASDRTRKQVLNQADCLERIRRLVRECVAEINKPPPDPETIELIQKRKAKANESRLIQKKMSSLTKQYRQKPTVYDL